MDELQHFGVEAEAVNGAGLIAVPVLAVAHYRTAFGRQMHTDLVGAAGLEVELDEGIIPLPASP